MKIKYEPQVMDLLMKLNELEVLYKEGYKSGGELKSLLGVERCIELKMKLLGYDGKSLVAMPVGAKRVVSIDLKRLSDETLREIVCLTEERDG